MDKEEAQKLRDACKGIMDGSIVTEVEVTNPTTQKPEFDDQGNKIDVVTPVGHITIEDEDNDTSNDTATPSDSVSEILKSQPTRKKPKGNAPSI